MFRILQIDGGGIRGVIPSKILAFIEKTTGKKICEIFDLITGTSTGAVIGGALASGKFSAADVYALYKTDVAKLFGARMKINPVNWFKPKYDRTAFLKVLRDKLGYATLSQCRCDLMITSFGLAAGRTHFIKSWSGLDGAIDLVDAVSWSALSAAYYFGAIEVPNYKWTYETHDGDIKDGKPGESFCDGGQGVNNCTIGSALIEGFARAKEDDEGIDILSIGCGAYDTVLDYKQSAKLGFFKQIGKYPFEARLESSIQQVMAAEYLASKRPSVHFKRINCSLPKEAAVIDATKHIGVFDLKADELISKHKTYLDGILKVEQVEKKQVMSNES